MRPFTKTLIALFLTLSACSIVSAAKRNDLERVQELLEQGEDPNTMRGQQKLPLTVETTPRASSTNPGFFCAYTPYGLREIDSAFCHRMLNPNSGGPYAVPFVNERATVGNEWWLVGSRGDSAEILAIEIQGSPLSPETKANLLENLQHCDFSQPPKFPP